MKILWMSDSPTSPSGFGNVTRFVCQGLAERGHQVHILGWQASGEPSRWRDCMLYPVRFDRFGADVLLNHLYRLRPEVLITLADVWWLTYIANPSIANFMRTAGIPWALYYPIDGDIGHGRLPGSWLHILRTVDLPIAMSQYGRHVTEANGLAPVYVPHGVDCTVFRPPPDKTQAKQALGYDGRFVILSDARNQPRKMLPRLLDIFRRFAAGKEDVLLHLHCDPQDPAACSPEYHYDLLADIAFLGLSEKVRITDGMSIAKGVSLEALAHIYQASDVHLLASWGEGFGLPTLQAAASGVVPMGSDYTATRELVLGHGEAIRVKDFIPDEFGILRALIDIDDACDKLERLYRDRHLLAAKSQAAVRFAQPYDWPNVVAQWDEMLRREIPKARQRASRPPPASQVTIAPQSAPGTSRLTQIVRRAMPQVPDGATVTLKVAESKPGELVSELFRDAARIDRRLTLPVSLPLPDVTLARSRVPGRVYVAGVRDAEIFRRMLALFPGLTAWSQKSLVVAHDAETGKPIRASVVPADGAVNAGTHTAYRKALAESTLALDLEATDPVLPSLAALLSVPCICSAKGADAWLWSELQNRVDMEKTLELVRTLLTDQGAAAAYCELARQRLGTHLVEEGRRIV
ncbi:MAG: glycosyltransferase family 4 protein [candidate division WOR-3 bacterium]